MNRKSILGVALFLGLTGLALWLNPFGKDDAASTILVRIPKGSARSQIVQILQQGGAIDSPAKFNLLSRLTLRNASFKHGTYLLEKNHYFKILRQLRQGLTYRVKVTFPEGWTAYQIAERLAKNGIIEDPEAFASLVLQSEREGTLYPETYYFEPVSDAESIANEMTRQFGRKFSDQWKARAVELRMTERQVLALASIIEREAMVDSERATISSVYHNRLKIRKLLEADPTVQYAISGGRYWKDRLTYKDLDSPSPYNTYRKPGLPPGPICNPGARSIEAALYPASTPFLYFVADPDGSGIHHFTETYDQHLRKQRELRRLHRQKKALASSGTKSQ